MNLLDVHYPYLKINETLIESNLKTLKKFVNISRNNCILQANKTLNIDFPCGRRSDVIVNLEEKVNKHISKGKLSHTPDLVQWSPEGQ